MKKLFAVLGGLMAAPAAASDSPLNYDDMIILDAEELAEGGIKKAYDDLLPRLKQFVPAPISIDEQLGADGQLYIVSFAGARYEVYSPESADKSWENATSIFFAAVNSQLNGKEYRFYAINGGNDLGGMFLTEAQYRNATKQLQKKSDWPYIPPLPQPIRVN